MTKISDWATEIINRDGRCVICQTKTDLEAHHVFKVNPHDKIYYGVNNGVALCKSCHEKYHERFGVDCSIKNLLTLQKSIGDKHTKRLKKENKQLKRVIKNMQKVLGYSGGVE